MIEGVSPEIDCGRFPIKRVIGESVIVEADIFADGHDQLSAVLRHRKSGRPAWDEVPFEPLGNDRWRASFGVTELGRHEYTIQAWVDHFKTWRHDLEKKIAASQDVGIDLLIGARLVRQAARRASEQDAAQLSEWATRLEDSSAAGRSDAALSSQLAQLVERYPDRQFAADYPKILEVVVDRERARFSSWYELFPRSTGSNGQHGTFRDVERHLPYVARMGFDVLYLPPIHPIGAAFRKGRNNTVEAGPQDPGSPWGIGSAAGGHKAIHPELGTLDDFRRLVGAAARHGLEIALDIAFQASPDHPYVGEHPEWFRQRPDGTIQYAENPPKKYQDIYPFDFESEAWPELWAELKSIFEFWIDQGVRIFRVDNPHTKSFSFWEWAITELKHDHPDLIFLSEAFTRPRVMYRLAKLGFTQSYTYFTWRNTKWELETYLTELTQTEVCEYFRPNFWPNTPDILSEHLQAGHRPTFLARLVLAATLAANYGIYGPAYELLEHQPLAPGREEYLNSEKYEIRDWDLNRPESIQDFVAAVNAIRRENPALQSDATLQFHKTDNEQLIAYTKTDSGNENVILTIVNLDPHHTHGGWVTLPLAQLDLDPSLPYQAHDLLTGDRFIWHGQTNYVQLNPHNLPAHILRIRRRVRSEHDFEYFM